MPQWCKRAELLCWPSISLDWIFCTDEICWSDNCLFCCISSDWYLVVWHWFAFAHLASSFFQNWPDNTHNWNVHFDASLNDLDLTQGYHSLKIKEKEIAKCSLLIFLQVSGSIWMKLVCCHRLLVGSSLCWIYLAQYRNQGRLLYLNDFVKILLILACVAVLIDQFLSNFGW